MTAQIEVEGEHSGGMVRAAKDFTAGWISGIAQVLVGQPFDTIKVRLQTQPTNQVPPMYAGPVDCLRKTLQQENVQGLYRGTLMPLLGVGLCVSIQFATLEAMKRAFLGNEKSKSDGTSGILSSRQLFISGTASGLANTVVAGPVEHVRIRCQVISQTGNISASNVADISKHRAALAQSMGLNNFYGPIDCARKIISTYGIRGLFQGQAITMLRDGLGFGFYFLSYEYLIQKALVEYRKTDPQFQRTQLPPHQAILFGALAGVCYWLPVYPIDVMKSKIQTDTLDPTKRKYPTIATTLSRIYKEQGMSGFFKGFSPCMARSAVVNAATFATFELAMRWLG
jgi:solute carrier family 25 carnitine/acylcarnitine transporter 20/29